VSEILDQLTASLGSQYRLERELGGGGMSRVFLAEEVALARKVVIKVLPPEMAAGVNQERFRREIQLAARLQHPHIVPLLAAGSAGDVLWYAMPFIEGESLRVKLARGELPVPEAVRILREVADALAYAHGQGVVHRDIKPDNVLLSGRHALVTDFGVAKAVSESTGAHTLTSLGLALGTPAYMAPEQASADPNVDHRADLYALGAMAYEMLAGHPPFSGMSAQSILASHITQTPATISSHRPAVPAALNTIVMRCLEKRPADRWQSADELMPHLDALLTPSGGIAPTGAVASVTTISSGTEAALRRGHPARVALLFGVASLVVLALVNLLVNRIGLPSWVLYGAAGLLLLGLPVMLATSIRERKRLLARTTGAAKSETGLGGMLTWKRALTGGGLAFAGLAGGAAVFMALRVAGVGPFATLLSAGVIKERDPLVVAEFENRTSDSTLAQSVTEALRIDLARSTSVRLLESGDVSATLRRMEKDPATPLTASLAREVAERTGAAAVVTGEIAPLGAGYVLSVRLIGTRDGATLLAERETADGAGGLIAAVDKLSKKVREGIGESLRTIRGGQPLEDVTTRSLDALRKYTQANAAADMGEQVKAREILRDAIRLDSNFAMAWRKLAALQGNLGDDFSGQALSATRAYQLRDRLPERERLLSTAYYYWVVDYDSDKIIAAYQQVLDTWPDDNTASNNLAIELFTRRRYAEAEAILDRAIANSPNVGVLYDNMNEALAAQGKFAKADSLAVRWGQAQPASSMRLSSAFRYTFARGQYDRALAYADSVGQRSDPNWQARSHHQRANVFRIRGQLLKAEREEQAEAEINRQAAGPTQAFLPVLDIARNDVKLRGKPEAGIHRVDSALAKYPMNDVDALDRPYLVLSDFYVEAGQLAKAERLLAEYERTVPEQLKVADFQRIYSTAMIALGKGQYADAITGFRAYRQKIGGEVVGLYEIALTFDKMGQTDSAVATYETYTTANQTGPTGRQYNLVPTYHRLGELYEGKNNKDKALAYYGKFLELWKDADPDLQPKVREVKLRMTALAGERKQP